MFSIKLQTRLPQRVFTLSAQSATGKKKKSKLSQTTSICDNTPGRPHVGIAASRRLHQTCWWKPTRTFLLTTLPKRPLPLGVVPATVSAFDGSIFSLAHMTTVFISAYLDVFFCTSYSINTTLFARGQRKLKCFHGCSVISWWCQLFAFNWPQSTVSRQITSWILVRSSQKPQQTTVESPHDLCCCLWTKIGLLQLLVM